MDWCVDVHGTGCWIERVTKNHLRLFPIPAYRQPVVICVCAAQQIKTWFSQSLFNFYGLETNCVCVLSISFQLPNIQSAHYYFFIGNYIAHKFPSLRLKTGFLFLFRFFFSFVRVLRTCNCIIWLSRHQNKILKTDKRDTDRQRGRESVSEQEK